MWQARLSLIGRLGTALVASAGIWFFLINRIVIHWVDCALKSASMIALAMALAWLAVFSVLRDPRAMWLRLWLAVLVLFGLGEVRRTWLRNEYRVDSSSAVDIWHPVTTTDLVVRRFELDLPALAVARVRVLHLSDLHVTEAVEQSYTQRVQEQIRALAPDLIVMTGDYLSREDRLPLLATWLEGLPGARYGTYAVLGNHYYWAGKPDGVRAVLERAGVRLVGGVCTNVDVATGRAFRLCGTEEPWGPGYSDAAPDRDSYGATLVLSHTPDNIYEVAERGATALFAGHTHGGQFRLPLLGPLVVPSRYGRRFEEGHFVVNGTHLFVSAGVGADDPALRLWCPPELIVVDLVGREALAHRM